MEEQKTKTKFVKEPEEPTREYIFQKNSKTKKAVYIIIVFLIILGLGIILSALNFFSPEL